MPSGTHNDVKMCDALQGWRVTHYSRMFLSHFDVLFIAFIIIVHTLGQLESICFRSRFSSRKRNAITEISCSATADVNCASRVHRDAAAGRVKDSEKLRSFFFNVVTKSQRFSTVVFP